MAAVLAPAAMAKGGGTNHTISLKGSISFPNATGKATSKVNGSERELQIEAEHIKVLAGKHVNVFVNGNKLASPVVNGLGHVHVDRNTETVSPYPRSSPAPPCGYAPSAAPSSPSGTF